MPMMSMSPQVQQGQMGPPPAEQAEQMFKERFSQMAYSVLFSRFPELAQNVVTFKILDVNADEGNGAGAFIILKDQLPLYIPAVMVDGQLKPVEMFYYKNLNIFLPLDNAWLEEITKMSLGEMGQPENPPDSVPRDVSVRNLVLPPYTTGRYGYASADPSPEALEHGVKAMLKAAGDHTLSIHPAFLDVLKKGNQLLLDGVKLAFEQHPALAQKFARVYGVKPLMGAFQEGYSKAKSLQKVASVRPVPVKVLTKDAAPSELREIFGDRAKEAFSRIMKVGYDVADNRDGTKLNRAIKIETERFLQEPNAEGGWYRLYFVDAEPEIFYIIPWPIDAYTSWGRVPCYTRTESHKVPTEFLAVSKDLKSAFVVDGLMGEPILTPEKEGLKSSALYKLLESGKGSAKPVAKSYGFFLVPDAKHPQATKPCRIAYALSDNGKDRYVTEYSDAVYVIDDDPSRKKVERANRSRQAVVFLPKNVTWVTLASNINKPADSPESSCTEEYARQRRNSVVQDPRLVTRWLDGKMQDVGAKVASVRKDGSGYWRVEKDPQSYSFERALEKVAVTYHISVPDAVGILKEAQANGRSNVRIVRGGDAMTRFLQGTLKLAQGPVPMEAQQTAQMQMGGMPPGAGGMPLGMEGMDPSMMQPPPPPSLSPTDLAITEAIQQLQQQNQMQMQQAQSQAEQMQMQMQQQAQQTEMITQLLTQIQQRASEIGQASGGMIPPEATGAPAAAAQMLAPQAPEEVPPPPMPTMDVGENVDPQAIAQQINPGLVEQADVLQDEGVFDTAAISMLASSPVLQDVVATYVPNMEKCLDNVGRVLLTLWMTETETKEAIGDEAFVLLEDKLRTVFKALGDVVIALSRNATSSLPDTQMQQGQAVGMR